MRKLFTAVVLTLGIAVIGTPAVFADEMETKTLLGDALEGNVSVSGAMDVYSKYVWRGFLLDKDTVFQPSFAIDAYGFSLAVWGSFDIDQKDALASDEIDTTLSYSYTLDDMVTLSAGYTYYDFRSADTYSSEFFIGAGLETLLSPTLTAYFDVGDEIQGGGDGQYYVLGVSHSFTLEDEYGITLDLGGHVGINQELYLAGDGGDVLLTAGLGLPLTDNLTMSLNTGYSMPFGDLEDSAIGNQDNEFYGGVSMGFSF